MDYSLLTMPTFPLVIHGFQYFTTLVVGVKYIGGGEGGGGWRQDRGGMVFPPPSSTFIEMPTPHIRHRWGGGRVWCLTVAALIVRCHALPYSIRNVCSWFLPAAISTACSDVLPAIILTAFSPIPPAGTILIVTTCLSSTILTAGYTVLPSVLPAI